MRHFDVTCAAAHYDNILRMIDPKRHFYLFILSALAPSSAALADEFDVINLNASGNVMVDDNLFRLRNGLSANSVGLKTKSDTVTSTSLGLNINKQVSLQRIIADISFQNISYKTYSYLDFRASNYNAKWLWAIGNRLSGDISAQQTQSLASFTDYSNYSRRNLRTVEEQKANFDYWLHSNWHIVGGLYASKLANQSAFLEDSDYQSTGYNAGIRYQPASGNKITWRIKQAEGKYKNRAFNTALQYDNGFSQNGQQFELFWQITGKSQIRGNLEYTKREHDHFSSRDYSGWIGNLDYIYAYSAKTSFSTGYRRGLDSYQQATTSYYSSDEINMGAQWAATSKILASAKASYVIRQFQGPVIQLPAGLADREDKFTKFGLDLSYRPDRWLELKIGANMERRSSNYSAYEYNDQTAYVSASGQF